MGTKTLALAFAAGIATMSAGSAQAATYVVSATYDPATLVEGAMNVVSLATPVTLGLGDTLDLTVNFLGGVRVSFAANRGFYSGVLTSTAGAGKVDTTISFGDASANLKSSWDQQNFAFSLLDYNVGTRFDSFLYRTDSAIDPSLAPPVVFSSFRNILTIIQHQSGPATRSFDRVAFIYEGGPPSVVRSTAPVPEPASWAMMIGGFALMGGMMRGRMGLRLA